MGTRLRLFAASLVVIGFSGTSLFASADAPPTQQSKATERAPASSPKLQNDPYLTPFLDTAAHFYQVDHGLAAVAPVRSQLTLNTNSKTADIRNIITRTGIEALGVFAPLSQVRGGVTYYRLFDTYASGVSTIDTSFDSIRKEEESNATPFAELDIAQSLSLGVEYSLTTRTIKPDDRETQSITSSRVASSVVFHRPAFEVGISYKPTVSIEENGMSQIDIGSTSLSAQYAVCEDISVGGALQQFRNADIDQDNLKNTLDAKLGAEIKFLHVMKAGASSSYRTGSAKEDAFATPTNIPRFTNFAFFSYGFSPTGRVGLSYYNYYGRKSIGEVSHKILGHAAELVGVLRF